MKLLGFLKRLFKKEEKEIEIEKINFDDIDDFISSKKKEVEINNKKFLDLIKDRINKFVDELNEKISISEEVDVDKIKFEEKGKIIVKENLNKYIDQVKKLIENLEELDTNNAIKIIKDIDDLFNNFEKRSSLNYQKTTILIGKELGAINDCISIFLTDVKKIIDKNKNSFDKNKILDSIEENLINKNKIEKLKSNIDKEIREQDNKIKGFEKEIEMIEKSKEDLRKTKSYIEKVEKKKEIESLKERLETEIYNLKKLIDFKQFTSFFHINQRDLEIIKTYKENFKKSFEEDENNQIIQLLNESNLITDGIKNKFGEILELKKNIDNFVPEKDETEFLNEAINKKKIEIENLNTEKTKEIKRYDKLNKNVIDIIDLVKKDLKKVGVEVG